MNAFRAAVFGLIVSSPFLGAGLAYCILTGWDATRFCQAGVAFLIGVWYGLNALWHEWHRRAGERRLAESLRPLLQEDEMHPAILAEARRGFLSQAKTIARN